MSAATKEDLLWLIGLLRSMKRTAESRLHTIRSESEREQVRQSITKYERLLALMDRPY